jgi:hypothetical protein
MLALTGEITSRIFALVKDLSIDAIHSGEECITDGAISRWSPVWSHHGPVQRRLEQAGQACPNCTLRSLTLKHWRRAWVFDCQICGAMLTSTLPKLGRGVLLQKLFQHARTGSVLLEQAVMQNSIRQIRRAMRGVSFAMALKNVSGDPASALQSFNPDIRPFCLAAIAVVQKRPLLKAALFATGIDHSARVALLRTYEKEDRLLVTVDRIGRQIENRTHASISTTIKRIWSSSRI